MFRDTSGWSSPPPFQTLMEASRVHGVPYDSPARKTGSARSSRPPRYGLMLKDASASAISNARSTSGELVRRRITSAAEKNCSDLPGAELEPQLTGDEWERVARAPEQVGGAGAAEGAGDHGRARLGLQAHDT